MARILDLKKFMIIKATGDAAIFSNMQDCRCHLMNMGIDESKFRVEGRPVELIKTYIYWITEREK